MRSVIALALALATACGGGHPGTHIDGGGGGGDAAGDAPGGGDAGVDAGAGCVQPGVPTVVSANTPAAMESPLIASNGTTTLIAWDVDPYGFDRAAWAEVENGAVIAHGTFDAGIDTSYAQLVVLGSKYYLFQHTVGANGLYGYDGSAWTKVAGFTADRVVPSGSTLFGIQAPINSAVSVISFDGTTVSAPTQVSTHSFADAAADGAGGLGVLTTDSDPALFFTSYSGGSWSAEASVGAPPSAISGAHLAHSGALWAAVGVPLTIGPATAWVDSAGTWTAASTGVNGYSGFVGNGGLFALGDVTGHVSVYKAGTWTATQVITTTTIDLTPRLAAFGNGFVYHMASQAAVFDGSSWGAPAGTMLGSADGMTASGSQIVAWSGNAVAIYDGTWTTTTIGARAIATFAGGDVVAAFATPGAMNERAAPGGTWGTPLALPVYDTSGTLAATAALLARAGNGHVLALWVQADNGAPFGFASEFDGCRWGAPVELATQPSYYGIAANATTFVVTDTSRARAGVWNGSGVGSFTTFGQNVELASDGTTFVAAWQQVPDLDFATSTDGVTWSSPQSIGFGGTLDGMVGGKAGVLAWSASGATVTASLWHAGAWSPMTSLTTVNASACQASVADITALIACPASTTASVELYANGAWTSLPAGDPYFVIGNDGTDYRMDYSIYAATRNSIVLHDGAWSAPATSGTLTTLATAGRNGAWLSIGAGTGGDLQPHYLLESATGTAGYGAPATLVTTPLVGGYSIHPFSNQGGTTDAALVSGHPAGYRGVAALYVALGL